MPPMASHQLDSGVASDIYVPIGSRQPSISSRIVAIPAGALRGRHPRQKRPADSLMLADTCTPPLARRLGEALARHFTTLSAIATLFTLVSAGDVLVSANIRGPAPQCSARASLHQPLGYLCKKASKKEKKTATTHASSATQWEQVTPARCPPPTPFWPQGYVCPVGPPTPANTPPARPHPPSPGCPPVATVAPPGGPGGLATSRSCVCRRGGRGGGCEWGWGEAPSSAAEIDSGLPTHAPLATGPPPTRRVGTPPRAGQRSRRRGWGEDVQPRPQTTWGLRRVASAITHLWSSSTPLVS